MSISVPQRNSRQWSKVRVINLIQTPVFPSRYLLWPARSGEAVMIILNDILLFACAITLVTGIVLTAARLFI